jgi:phage gpG-like protein
MSQTTQTPMPDFIRMGRDLKRIVRVKAGKMSVDFFKKSFLDGGFTDGSLDPWPASRGPLVGKRTLYKKGILMRSIHVSSSTDQRIVVTSDTDYSEIHNNGGKITVTEAMKRYFWAMYYRHGGGKLKGRGKKATAGNSRAQWCKNMALMKVGSVITIPKRQFMGESKTLMADLNDMFAEEIVRIFQNTPQTP